MPHFKKIKHEIGDVKTIAKMTAISERTVSAILNGHRNPDTPKGKKILKALAVLNNVRNQKV